MTRKIITLLIVGLILTVAIIFLISPLKYVAIMRLAPPGIHGLYSLADYDLVYKTKYDKDTLLSDLAKDGLVIKSGRLHDYDPPWDSLRYLIDNITCDKQKIEPYIEFHREKQKGFTTFRILWINAAPNKSYDTTLYRTLTKK